MPTNPKGPLRSYHHPPLALPLYIGGGEGEEAWGARDGEGEYYNIMRIIEVVVKLNNNSS